MVVSASNGMANSDPKKYLSVFSPSGVNLRFKPISMSLKSVSSSAKTT
jgi:hypothetical protein